jgi:predicted O-methyltransferase YrrM
MTDAALVARKPWQSRFLHVPKALDRVPTMLTPEECRMLVWLSQEYYSGAGALVELGAFVGGSTARLAYGLKSRGLQARLHAFDRFEVQERHKERFLYSQGIEPFEGSDVLTLSKTLLGELAEYVEYHKGNVLSVQWDGSPIEILFVDIAKSPEMNNHVMQTFFPALIPGRSIVIHQDYLHFQTPWLAPSMEALSDCFELIAWTEQNSVLFLCIAPVTASALAAANFNRMPPEQVRALALAAARKFPYVRQQEAVLEGYLAWTANERVENAWEIRRPTDGTALQHLVSGLL